MFRADMSTLRCLKCRSSARRRVYFLTFDAGIPHLGPGTHPFTWLLPLELGADGQWRAIGGAGGAGGVPPRAQPWVNLAGGYGGDLFYAGGHIDGAGADVSQVRIVFADGLVLTDASQDGVAVFIADQQVVMPSTVELYDRAGALVGAHEAFPGQ